MPSTKKKSRSIKKQSQSGEKKSHSGWWILSNLFLLVCVVAVVCLLVFVVKNYEPHPNQITSEEQLKKIKTIFKNKYTSLTQGEPVFIPVGFYIDSLQFKDPNTIAMSGVVWQKIPKNALNLLDSAGITFPEASAQPNLKKIYTIDYDDYRLIGWRFVGLQLYEDLDYHLFPFDKQNIWLVVAPEAFYKNIIFIPDLSSYPSTSLGSVFGLNKAEINMFEFDIMETFFEYDMLSYKTNFGMKDSSVSSRPRLYFDIIIHRFAVDGLVLYFIPIIVIWTLLFGLTMFMSTEVEQQGISGGAPLRMITALGGSFFAVVMANINLRTKFMGQPATYVEWYYYLTYVVIALLVLNVHLISSSTKPPAILSWEDNLLPKLFYWPFIAFSVLCLTLWKFKGPIFYGKWLN